MVTATKRSESIQDVPLAITALSGEFVSKVNLDDVKDLVSFTPGVTGNSQDSFIDAISVRGIRTQEDLAELSVDELQDVDEMGDEAAAALDEAQEEYEAAIQTVQTDAETAEQGGESP